MTIDDPVMTGMGRLGVHGAPQLSLSIKTTSIQSINLFCHTQTQLAVITIANTFRLCVTGSTQGAYAPLKRATHVQ